MCLFVLLDNVMALCSFNIILFVWLVKKFNGTQIKPSNLELVDFTEYLMQKQLHDTAFYQLFLVVAK